MEYHCPICNFVVKEKSEIKATYEGSKDKKKKVIAIHCHHCGPYKMAEDCAKDFRRHYLSFNVESQMGRENYDENIKMIHEQIRHHHLEILSHDLIHKRIPLLHMPRV